MIALSTAWLFIMKYSTQFHRLTDYYPSASRMNLLDLLSFVDYFLISNSCPVAISLLQDRNILIKCCMLFWEAHEILPLNASLMKSSSIIILNCCCNMSTWWTTCIRLTIHTCLLNTFFLTVTVKQVRWFSSYGRS